MGGAGDDVLEQEVQFTAVSASIKSSFSNHVWGRECYEEMNTTLPSSLRNDDNLNGDEGVMANDKRP